MERFLSYMKTYILLTTRLSRPMGFLYYLAADVTRVLIKSFVSPYNLMFHQSPAVFCQSASATIASQCYFVIKALNFYVPNFQCCQCEKGGESSTCDKVDESTNGDKMDDSCHDDKWGESSTCDKVDESRTGEKEDEYVSRYSNSQYLIDPGSLYTLKIGTNTL